MRWDFFRSPDAGISNGTDRISERKTEVSHRALLAATNVSRVLVQYMAPNVDCVVVVLARHLAKLNCSSAVSLGLFVEYEFADNALP